MPELPEVEVTCRLIEPLLVGRRIRSAWVSGESPLFATDPARLRRGLAGRTVRELGRRGKYLVAHLDGDARLVIHLGMTGQLFTEAVPGAAGRRPRPRAHTHLRLRFDDGRDDVLLRDPRKFGKVLLLENGASHPRLDRLGVDALKIDGEKLFRATRRRTAAIKAVLLDQSVIAGVGNIYADEALFRARVRPTRRSGRLTRRECAELARALRRVLRRAIRVGGSSISDFAAPDGSDGRYQRERRVYARAGQPCPSCGGPIRKVVAAGRGTHYCPACQR